MPSGPRRLADRLRRGGRRGAGLVLLYHRLGEGLPDPWALAVSPAHFAEHLDVLRRRTRPVPLPALRASLAGRPPAVAVTFDDGYADNLERAAPLLAGRGVPATVFVVSGHVGSTAPFWWDELADALLAGEGLPETVRVEHDGRTLTLAGRDRVAAYHDAYTFVRGAGTRRDEALARVLAACGRPRGRAGERRAMSVDEVLRLDAQEGVDVGAHTVTHPVLSALDPARQREEITRSRETLERVLGRPVTVFSYPHGQRDDFTRETAVAVRDAGFQLACAAYHGVVTPATDPFELPRVVVGDWSGDEFEARLDAWLRT